MVAWNESVQCRCTSYCERRDLPALNSLSFASASDALLPEAAVLFVLLLMDGMCGCDGE
jgi:hypothetical protein